MLYYAITLPSYRRTKNQSGHWHLPRRMVIFPTIHFIHPGSKIHSITNAIVRDLGCDLGGGGGETQK